MQYKRRKYIVNTGFQGRFVIAFITVALIGCAAASVLFDYLGIKRLEALRWSVFITAQSTGEVLKPIFIYVNFLSFIFVSVLLLITMVWILRRADGPIYRIIKDLKLIQAGNFSNDMVLRQKDEFYDVGETLNEMLNKIRQTLIEGKAGYETISQGLIELEVAHAKDLPIKEEIELLLAEIQKLKKQVNL